MRTIRFAFLVSIVLALMGCAKDGGDGKAFAVVDGGTADVTGLDLDGVGAPGDCDSSGQCKYFFGKKYELRKGTGQVLWESNRTVYGMTVNVAVNSGSKATDLGLTKGKDGDDKIYHLFFSGNTMTVSAAPTPSLSEMNPMDSRQQIDSAREATGLVREGQLKELD